MQTNRPLAWPGRALPTASVLSALLLCGCSTAVKAALGPEAPEDSCEDLDAAVTAAVPEGPRLVDGVLDASDPVPILEDSRGGWFLPVRVVTQGLGSIVWVDISLVAVDDGTLLSERSIRVQLVDTDECELVLPWFEAFLDPTVLDEEAPLAALDGTRAELVVVITDREGVSATGGLVVELDTTRVVAVGDTGEPGKP